MASVETRSLYSFSSNEVEAAKLGKAISHLRCRRLTSWICFGFVESGLAEIWLASETQPD